MQQLTTSQTRLSIGIDLGDRYSHLFVLDPASGAVIEEGRIRTTKQAFVQRFSLVPPALIAIETGTHSPWVSQVLKEAGHDVVVANARKTRLIYENDSKSDRVDAEWLARLAAADRKLLHPTRPRSAQTHADRAVLIARDQAVTSRTKLINCIRGLVKSLGKRLPTCSAGSFHRTAREHIPAELEPAVFPLLEVLEQLREVIRAYDQDVERISRERYPQTKLLRQVPGVGPITALWYVLTIEDPSRFERSRNVGSFVGLRPANRSSGRSNPEMRITKAGDPMLRRLLVQCSQYILGRFGPDTDLKRWGTALAGRGGKAARRRAIVAVARKLSVLLHRLWVSGEPYEPLRNAEPAVNAD